MGQVNRWKGVYPQSRGSTQQSIKVKILIYDGVWRVEIWGTVLLLLHPALFRLILVTDDSTYSVLLLVWHIYIWRIWIIGEYNILVLSLDWSGRGTEINLPHHFFCYHCFWSYYWQVQGYHLVGILRVTEMGKGGQWWLHWDINWIYGGGCRLQGWQ